MIINSQNFINYKDINSPMEELKTDYDENRGERKSFSFNRDNANNGS